VTGFVPWERDGVARGVAEWVLPEGWPFPDADGPPSGESSHLHHAADRILFFHGGAYVYFSPSEGYRPFTTRLANTTGLPVLAIDYRLAPEHPYPAAVVDAIDALAWVNTNGPRGAGAARSVYLCGDSAGGGLVLAALLAKHTPAGLPAATTAAAAAIPTPTAAVTLSAYSDLTCAFSSYRTRTYGIDEPHGDFVFSVGDPARDAEVESIACYHGKASPRLPTLSPIYASADALKMLPPLLMLVGDAELMLSDTTEFAARALDAGIPSLDVKVYRRMWHVWPMYDRSRPMHTHAHLLVHAHTRISGFCLRV
jgi:monoterpene epsilon-lactone hydrolase